VLRLPKRRQNDPDAFHTFLHEAVRSPHLARLPRGARTILHGGAAGSWYFEWFAEHYPTEVERHIGVDAYAGPPDGLPANVQWIQSSLGDLSPVEDGSVDLVFAGQVLEHLWPDEVVGFLCESHRVLAPGGTIALDSPNRIVTEALDWNHPEHTIEFSVPEILELLALAGFGAATVRGLWVCYDSKRGRVLPLDALEDRGRWPKQRRLELAETNPDDSFIWWVEAPREEVEPDRVALTRRIDELYRDYRRHRLGRFQHDVGSKRDGVFTASKGSQGHLLFGPFVPMPPGKWRARFRVAAGPARRRDRIEDDGILGWLNVVRAISILTGPEAEPVAERTLRAADVPPDGRWLEVELPFELDQTAFAVQFRARTSGRTRLSVAFDGVVEVGPDVSDERALTAASSASES